MSNQPVEQLVVEVIEGYEPEIGRSLWLLEEARARTQESIADLDQKTLEWMPPTKNSIGSLLYHIAAIEIDWLFAEVLQAPFSAEVEALFPYSVRQDGDLTAVSGLTLAQHLERLAQTRHYLRQTYQEMTLADFRRIRHIGPYDVTPEWVLGHLALHEAEHRGEIVNTLVLYRQQR